MFFTESEIDINKIETCSLQGKTRHWRELYDCLPCNKKKRSIAAICLLYLEFLLTLQWLYRTSLSWKLLPSHKQPTTNIFFCFAIFLSFYCPVVLSCVPCSLSIQRCLWPLLAFLWKYFLSITRGGPNFGRSYTCTIDVPRYPKMFRNGRTSHECTGFSWFVCFDWGPSGMGSRPDSGDFCFADVPKCPKISPKKKSHVSKLVSKCPKMSQTGKGTVLAVVFVI